MGVKIRLFVVLMFFCLASLNIANAYNAYLNIYIVDLNTNSAEDDPIKLVDHANSPIQWKLVGTGCSPTSYTDDIANGEYGNGDTIRTGSPATLTEDSSCTLYLKVDEVKVGSYYYGGCVTDTTASLCTTCAGAGAGCQVEGTSTYIGTPTNGYSYSYYQSDNTVGATGVCDSNVNFGDCSDEIQDTIYSAQTTEFSFGFTA